MSVPPPSDTIVALASARGRAGIAIVRLSGPKALEIGWPLFSPNTKADRPPPRKMILGRLLAADGTESDEILFVYFPEKNSYTGEPVVEFHLHGGPVVVEGALETLVAAGARPAAAGEFTRRAFLNGRIDLSQAEAVADLIAAKSLVAARVAHRRLAGALSGRVERLHGILARAMALVEAEIDFPDEDIGRIDAAEVAGLIDQALAGVEALLAGHARARALAQGAVVVLAGRPNAGKSSLLNRLAGARRALVHEKPGTTRDLIEAEIELEGIPVRLIDTAGLRRSEDEVERQGVDLALETIAGADLTVYLVDGEVGVNEEDRRNVESLPPERRVVVWNKCDLRPPDRAFAAFDGLPVSATEGAGLEELSRRIVRRLGAEAVDGEALLATVRHRDLVGRAGQRLEAARQIALTGRDHELAAEELRDAAEALGELVGRATPEEVLDHIFSRFCVGK